MFKSLSGRFLILTIVFVMLAEVLIFVPSVARFREDFLALRLERAQIASLALLADDMLTDALEAELLENAGVFNVVLHRDATRQLVLASDLPGMVAGSFDLRNDSPWQRMRDALDRLWTPQDEVIRVLGSPVRDGGELIEVTMATGDLRAAMIDYGTNILVLSAVISVVTAALLFVAVQLLMVRPIRSVVGAMHSYAAAPEDARRIIAPASGITELREAEDSLHALQTELTGALRQKDRLAQLGIAVAKVSHDLRNILTSSQLFADRIEQSEDPTVARLAPKLVRSITRAIHLCESTLAFGRAEEAPPHLERFSLAPLVADVIETEQLATPDPDLDWVSDVPAGLMLRADREQLHRVLLNLMRNAAQALAGQGGAQIQLRAREDDAAWQIEVSDTGPGLPERAKEHLFKPFQGGARKGGSGLGLSIAAELVRGHGGTLRYRDGAEGGAVFEIYLPK